MENVGSYYEVLNHEDKEFILAVLRDTGSKYDKYHHGTLALVDLKTVKKAIRDIQSFYASPRYHLASRFANARKMKSMKKRVLKHLSPELLARTRQRQARKNAAR